jgi:TMEM175 potassium channel family protein
MTKGRLEAFSDGVLAIIITIMVLELRPPHEPNFSALNEVKYSFLGYVLSFIYVGIYWNNHHHLFQAVHRVNGAVLWANLHLLFWLSLVPFATSWMGSSEFQATPVAAYGAILIMAGIAYFILAHSLLPLHGEDSHLARAIGRDIKGKLSVAIYAVAIPISFLAPIIACALYVVVAVIWLVPDRRIEMVLNDQPAPNPEGLE